MTEPKPKTVAEQFDACETREQFMGVLQNLFTVLEKAIDDEADRGV